MWSNPWINALSHWYVTVKDDNVFLCHLKLLKSKKAWLQHLFNSPGNVIAYAAKCHRRARLFEAFGDFFSACYRLCIIIIDCVVVFWLFVASSVVYSTFKYHFRYIDTPAKRPARDGVGLVELVPMPTHFVFDVSQLIPVLWPCQNLEAKMLPCTNSIKCYCRL